MRVTQVQVELYCAFLTQLTCCMNFQGFCVLFAARQAAWWLWTIIVWKRAVCTFFKISTFAFIHTSLDRFVDKFNLFTRTCCFFKENINSFVVDAHHKCHNHSHYACLNEVFWCVCRWCRRTRQVWRLWGSLWRVWLWSERRTWLIRYRRWYMRNVPCIAMHRLCYNWI